MLETREDAAKLARTIFKAFFVFSLLGLIVCLFGFGSSAVHAYPLWTKGVSAEGVIVDLQQATSRTKFPVVQFSAANGTLTKFTSDVDDSSATRGQKVPVLYVQDNPTHAIIDRGVMSWFVTFFWLFGAVGCFLGSKRFWLEIGFNTPPPLNEEQM